MQTNNFGVVDRLGPGSKVRDKDGDEWTALSDGRWYWKAAFAIPGVSTAALLAQHGPVTLL